MCITERNIGTCVHYLLRHKENSTMSCFIIAIRIKASCWAVQQQQQSSYYCT